MKLKKGKIDKDIKMCKFCSKEYKDQENFNWSCRTHQYEFSGEMWWCCGKRGRDQPGCKFAKHESKEDDDDEDAGDKVKDQQRVLKYTKCNCCKELGHTIEQCPRDPNLKTKQHQGYDFQRVLKLQEDNRKLF